MDSDSDTLVGLNSLPNLDIFHAGFTSQFDDKILVKHWDRKITVESECVIFSREHLLIYINYRAYLGTGG